MPEETAPTNLDQIPPSANSFPKANVATTPQPTLNSNTPTPPSTKKSLPTKILVATVIIVIVLLAVLAFIFFRSNSNSTPSSNSQTTSNTANGIDNSSLDKSVQTINNDLNTLSGDETNIDKGLNNQAPNLNY